MRFEAKHSFFKRVVHNVHNFKNILQTLSTQHQLMVAHVMQSPSFFKQSIHVDKVKVVKVSSLERKVKTAVEKKIVLTLTLYLLHQTLNCMGPHTPKV